MPTHDEIIEIDSSYANSLLTINQTINRTLNPQLVGSFNTTTSDASNTSLDSAYTNSILTINKSIIRVLSAWTTAFDFTFVGIIIFVKEISVDAHRALRILDIDLNPMIFHDRLNGNPIIFKTRANGNPIIFHSISGLSKNINQTITFIEQVNTSTSDQTVPISAAITNSILAVSKSQSANVTMGTTFDYAIEGDALLTLTEPLTLSDTFEHI